MSFLDSKTTLINDNKVFNAKSCVRSIINLNCDIVGFNKILRKNKGIA